MINAFFSGSVDPRWPHLILITFGVLASVAVGVGIVLEAERKCSIPTLLVIVGVVLEAICTILLFEFDEGISGSQQSTIKLQQATIISLQREAGPRKIRTDDRAAMEGVLSAFRGTPYDISVPPTTDRSPIVNMLEPGSSLVENIVAVLNTAGWKLQSVEGDVSKADLPQRIVFITLPNSVIASGIPVTIPRIRIGQISNVVGIKLVWVSDERLRDASDALMHELNKFSLSADPDFPPPYNNIPVNAITGNAVHVIIGSKP